MELARSVIASLQQGIYLHQWTSRTPSYIFKCFPRINDFYVFQSFSVCGSAMWPIHCPPVFTDMFSYCGLLGQLASERLLPVQFSNGLCRLCRSFGGSSNLRTLRWIEITISMPGSLFLCYSVGVGSSFIFNDLENSQMPVCWARESSGCCQFWKADRQWNQSFR